jgi:hypothetical protein
MFVHYSEEEASGTPVRKVAAEIDKGLVPATLALAEKFRNASFDARQCVEMALPELVHGLEKAPTVLRGLGAALEEQHPKLLGLPDQFLLDVMRLVEATGVRSALPPKHDYDRAREFPIFKACREAIQIASDIALKHAPRAARQIRRLHKIKDATLVDRLHRIHRAPWYK